MLVVAELVFSYRQYVRPGSRMCGIGRMLNKHIRRVGLTPRKVSNYLSSVKKDVRLKIAVAYSIPGECGQVYM